MYKPRCIGASTSWEFLAQSLPLSTLRSAPATSGNALNHNFGPSNTLSLDGENLENGVNFVYYGCRVRQKGPQLPCSLWKMGEFVPPTLSTRVLSLRIMQPVFSDWGLGYACTTMLATKPGTSSWVLLEQPASFGSTISEQVGYKNWIGGVYSIPRDYTRRSQASLPMISQLRTVTGLSSPAT